MCSESDGSSDWVIVPRVAIALGSNLGDRRAHLEFAVTRLKSFLKHARVSSFIETDPVDVPDPQPKYLNGVVVGETDLAPEAVMRALAAIEQERGRTRPSLRASRTLDLDLILYGDVALKSETLEIPHPRFRERKFVLEPLTEIAPEMVDPVTGETVRDLLAQLRTSNF